VSSVILLAALQSQDRDESGECGAAVERLADRDRAREDHVEIVQLAAPRLPEEE
jgi:hypothetical protein